MTPVRKGTWLKLALVVFFVGSFGIGGMGFPGNFGASTDDPTFEGEQPTGSTDLPVDDVLFWVLAILAVVLVLGLAYDFVAAVMEFVFLESLRSSDVRLRRYFSANLGKGLWLFLFRLGLQVLVGALAVVPAVAIILSMESGLDGVSATLLLLYILYALVLGVIYSIVMRFTTDFVTPIMLLEDRGVLASWGRFRATLRANWADYGVYLLLVWVLQLIVGIAAGLVLGLGGLLLAIPFAIVAILLFIALDAIGLVLAILVALVGLVLFAVFALLFYVPITAYFRYYALLLLGDADIDLDLIPDRREAVRNGGLGSAGRDDAGDGTESGGFESDDGSGWGDSDGRDGSDGRDDSSGWDDSGDWDGEPDDQGGSDSRDWRDDRDGSNDRDEDDGWR
ncbi:hypothetical protein [Natrinema versiforme]|uniref:DUF7544 domain-containing protein n=1 Tax=Natrinema versiforme TaxID=88724 RepID=UPI001E624462|nr:hypothetical protein [Natrinema versiforme]